MPSDKHPHGTTLQQGLILGVVEKFGPLTSSEIAGHYNRLTKADVAYNYQFIVTRRMAGRGLIKSKTVTNARGQKIFGAQKAGQLVMSWRELDPILGRNLQDFADRFSIEQDMDIRVGQNYDRMPASRLNPDLFIRWCNDVISHRGDGT